MYRHEQTQTQVFSDTHEPVLRLWLHPLAALLFSVIHFCDMTINTGLTLMMKMMMMITQTTLSTMMVT